jgi:hypothetical protein
MSAAPNVPWPEGSAEILLAEHKPAPPLFPSFG